MQGVAGTSQARRIEYQLRRTMEASWRYQKQSEVGSHPTFEAGPGALGVLRVDGAGTPLDAEGAGKLRNAPGGGDESA